MKIVLVAAALVAITTSALSDELIVKRLGATLEPALCHYDEHGHHIRDSNPLMFCYEHGDRAGPDIRLSLILQACHPAAQTFTIEKAEGDWDAGVMTSSTIEISIGDSFMVGQHAVTLSSFIKSPVCEGIFSTNGNVE